MGSNTLASRIVGGNSAFGRNKSDFYPTPPEATQTIELLADSLIANGVTFAKGKYVPSKWISVEDGMPEPMVWVLCACRANIIEVLRYDRNIDGWGTAGPNRGYMKSFVTHWMPLPEPPEVLDGNDHV